MKQLYLEKEPYEKNGKQFHAYVVKGSVMGTILKATLTPPDVGGYQLLNLIFGDKNAVELKVKPFQMTTESGEVLSGNTYSVEVIDEDGTICECKMKPLKATDKSILKMLVK